MTRICYLCEAVKQCEPVGIEKLELCHQCCVLALSAIEIWKDIELIQEVQLLKSQIYKRK